MFVTASSLGQHQSEQVEEIKHELAKDACDLQALSKLTTLLSESLKTGRDPNPSQTLEDLAMYSTRGLKCLNDVTSKEQSAEPATIKKELIVTFSGGAGYAALRNQQYLRAQRYFKRAVDADPNNMKNVFSLALSYLGPSFGSTPPRETVAGLFYVARAASLAPEGSKERNDLEEYTVRAYTDYHGSREGCDALLNTAKKYGAPPLDFSITKKPDSHNHR